MGVSQIVSKITGCTQKEELFVKAYIEGLSTKKAAIKAGYTENTADDRSKEILGRERVQRYLNCLRKKAEDQALLSFDYKLAKLARIAHEFIPDDGAILIDSARAGIAAIAEANKMQGDYAAEKRMVLNVNADVDVISIKNKILDLTNKYISEY